MMMKYLAILAVLLFQTIFIHSMFQYDSGLTALIDPDTVIFNAIITIIGYAAICYIVWYHKDP